MRMAGVRSNIVAVVYGMAVLVIGQAALVPLFLRMWGPVVYGQWLVISAVPAYLALAELGIGHALGNLLAISIAQGRIVDAQNKFNAAFKYQGLIGAALFFLFCGMVVMLPIANWLVIGSLSPNGAIVVLLSLVVYSILPIQIGCFSGIYRAASLYHRYLLFQGHARLLEVICTAVLLISQCGMVEISVALLAVRFLWFLVVVFDSRGRVAGLRVRWDEGSWREFSSLLPVGFGYFAFPIGNALINQGVVLLVNHLGGVAAVVELSVGRQVCRFFLQLTSAISAAVHPELTLAFARGERARLLALQAGVIAVVVVIGGVFVVACFIIGPGLAHWWTQGVAVSAVTFGLLALEAVTAGLANVSLLLPWAANRLGSLPYCYLALQVLSITAVALSFSLWRVGAVGLAFTLINCAFGVIAVRKMLRLTSCRAAEFPGFGIAVIVYIMRSSFGRLGAR